MRKQRAIEVAAIIVACGLALRLLATLTLSWNLLPAVLLGAILADFLSGLVHWAADTFGSPSTPFFGSAIRCFREHHDDPQAITQHGFVETNGNNALMTVPILLLAVAIGGFAQAVVTVAAVFLLFTNQFHRWAHGRPPALVHALQFMRLLPSPQSHDVHHASPFDRGYCITFGWLNRPLDAIGFWRWLGKKRKGKEQHHAETRE